MRDLGTGPKNTEELLSRRQHERALSAFGSNDPDVLFQGRPSTLTPWPSAAKKKKGQTWNRDLIHEELSKPPELVDVDPRFLTATQPNILREHVSHYMGDSYEKTGRTAADQDQAGNQYPVVYKQPQGRYDIISGHHRATVALLKGESLRARVIRDKG
jgi:hypothetical protein